MVDGAAAHDLGPSFIIILDTKIQSLTVSSD